MSSKISCTPKEACSAEALTMELPHAVFPPLVLLSGKALPNGYDLPSTMLSPRTHPPVKVYNG